ncbi:MAG: phosphatidylglycerophosphatase A [Burkholderiaceae bacterium]|nr:phosphatidylglycerophosphatase A [Burkholderiaceae bacterium]
MTATDSSAPSSSPADAPPRLGLAFLFAHPAHAIALGLGSGLARLAPGTSGTLWAWATFVIWQRFVPAAQFDAWTAAVLAVSLPLGWWACTVTARHMNVADPGQIVWDEIVAFWLVLWLIVPVGFFGQLAAFLLFRYFDAAKPGPVRWADSLFKGFGARGGFGILFDDLVAAFCTLLVIALWRWVW